jgi:hypothetical protein
MVRGQEDRWAMRGQAAVVGQCDTGTVWLPDSGMGQYCDLGTLRWWQTVARRHDETIHGRTERIEPPTW